MIKKKKKGTFWEPWQRERKTDFYRETKIQKCDKNKLFFFFADWVQIKLVASTKRIISQYKGSAKEEEDAKAVIWIRFGTKNLSPVATKLKNKTWSIFSFCCDDLLNEKRTRAHKKSGTSRREFYFFKILRFFFKARSTSFDFRTKNNFPSWRRYLKWAVTG